MFQLYILKHRQQGSEEEAGDWKGTAYNCGGWVTESVK